MPFRDQYNIPAGEIFLKGHPQRFLSLDDFAGLWQGKLESLSHHRLHSVRSKLNALQPQDPDRGTGLLRLADALSRRFWQLNQRDDVEEAIWCYEEAVSLLPKTHYHFLEAILGLCSSLYQRFRLLGHLDDLKKLLGHLQTEHNLDLESLLAPVKAQLQARPKQLIDESSDSDSEEPHFTPEELVRHSLRKAQMTKDSLDLPSKLQTRVQSTGLESLDTADETIHNEV